MRLVWGIINRLRQWREPKALTFPQLYVLWGLKNASDLYPSRFAKLFEKARKWRFWDRKRNARKPQCKEV